MATEQTTQAQAETEATTPAQAETEQTTQQQAETADTPEVYRTQEQFEAAFKARLERERKQWQLEKEEIEKRAKMDETQRLKAEKEDAEKKVQEAEARAQRAERKAALAGKVADPEAALKLLSDDHLDEDGNVSVEALLKSYPFLKPQNSPGLDGPNPAGGGKTRPANMSKEEFEALEKRVLAGERITL